MSIINRADSLKETDLERGQDDVNVEETYNKFIRDPSLIINIETFDKVLKKYPDIIDFRSISKLIDFLFNQPQPRQRKNMIISMIKAWKIIFGAYDSLERLTHIYKSISKKKKESMTQEEMVNLITNIQNAIINKMFYVQFGENINLSDYFISINNKLEAKTNLEPEDIGRIFILSEALDDKLSYYLKYIISNLHEWKLLKREEPEYENNSTAIIEIKLLLERGAELNIMDENLIDIIDEKIKHPDEEEEDYTESYNIIKGILLNAMAIQLILATPMTLKRTNPTIGGVDLVTILLNSLLYSFKKRYPDAFKTEMDTAICLSKSASSIIKPYDTDKIVFDIATQEETNIKDYLAEDENNHIALREYNDSGNGGDILLINIQNIKTLINDGSAITYKCSSPEELLVLPQNIDNLHPYFNMQNVTAISAFLPLLELYNKLINIPVEERGQLFYYRYLPNSITMATGINNVSYMNEINRYNEEINVVSGLHCQKDEGYTFTVISLHSEKELQELGCVSSEPTTKGGKKMTKKRAYTKKRGSKYKKMTKKPSKRSTKKRTPMKKTHIKTIKKRGHVKKEKRKTITPFNI